MKIKNILYIFLLCFVANDIFSQTAQFSANTTSLCIGSTVQFNDLSSGTITSWLWDFGDGNTSSSQNPQHTYTSIGSFTVSLTINGSVDTETKTNYIQVLSVPVVNFTSSAVVGCSLPFNVSFTNTNVESGVTYVWNFGDGNTSTDENPTHSFTNYGNYNVILTGTNGVCSSTDTLVITIQNFTANFAALPTTLCVNEAVSFLDASFPSPVSWLWNFGDGNSSTLQNPTHTYTVAGTYTVTLNAVSSLGCTDDLVLTNYITVNPLPTVSFTVDDDASCYVPFTANFTNTSPSLVSFDWNFGDGNTSNIQNPSNTYLNYGNYSVSLTGTDANGCENTFTASNFIQIAPIQAQVTSNVVNGCKDLNVSFTDLTTSLDPLSQWSWNFDFLGSTSTIQNPTFTYTDTGSFLVEMIVQTTTGCIDTTYQLIEVGIPPVVNMNPVSSVECHPFNASFIDLSSAYSDAWFWDFGDGNTSGLQNPTNVYTIDTGFFDVTLTASFHGCSATQVFNNAIYVKPSKPIFTIDSIVDCFQPWEITFSDQSLGAEKWTWKLGFPGGVVDIFAPPGDLTFTYLNPGTYTVWLITENFTYNCIDSISQTIYLSDLTAQFSQDTTATCTPNSIQFNDASTGVYPVVSWNWQFEDGGVAFTNNTSYNFLGVPGLYDVTLIVSDNVGCTKSIQKNDLIDIKPLPTVGFITSPTVGCLPLNTSFTDTSTSVVPLQTWVWNYGDGTVNDTVQNGAHTYNTNGQFNVSLSVTDLNNCTNTLLVNNAVTITQPIVNFNAPLFSCAYNSVAFENLSTGADPIYIWNFGDGSTLDSTFNPIHFFPNTVGINSYAVNLVVVDSNGCTEQLSKFITISQPKAQFTLDNDYIDCPPLNVNFTDLSQQFIAARDWSFGDGFFGIDSLASHTYNIPGLYDVRLIVTDIYGCRDTLIKEDTIFVDGVNGNALVTKDTLACGQTFNFTITPNSGTNINYTWDFGDGNTSNQQNIIYVYSDTGYFVPSITMVDQNNCTVTLVLDSIYATKDGTISVNLSSNLSSTTTNLPVQFTATSPQNIVSWYWNFGDGVQFDSVAAVLIHKFKTGSVFNIIVEGTDDQGCRGIDSIYVTIIDNSNKIGNVFSPNGDGYNDVFIIFNNDAQLHELRIYNRWGQLLYFGSGKTLEWYGKDFSGNDVTEGTYYYILNTVEGNGNTLDRTGYITVIR